MTEMPTGALERWLTPAADPDTAPDGSATRRLHALAAAVGPADAPSPSDAPAPEDREVAGEEVPEVAAMRRQLARLRATAVLQRDPAWLDVLSPREERRERGAARRLRGMRRDQHLAAATATVRLAGRERRAADRLAELEVSDRIWQRRALARRTRLLDPTSRLAGIARVHAATSAALIALAIAGIVWTSVGVHDALVGPTGPVLAYIVEPLFSLPLIVIMGVHAVAAAWGRAFPAREHRRKVYALEAGLWAATTLLNVSPIVPGLGRWVDTTVLLAHLAPPTLILVAVVLQPMVAGFLAAILADAHVDAGDAAGARLEADTVDVLALVAKVWAAIAAGELAVAPGTGRPSTEAIRRHFACEKRRAQGVADALALLDTPPTAPAGSGS
ncbi:hypothetical protein [uncultured Pseudonocardia sp.]|jgi:hypothetical protein|uniref:hypothetical protein n=1 Tax=uncultured Pseudonocardia sp. TaxID=211455 RepID=UPI00262510A1|nr:hypothetical protein [uncultured Pseudonocardia sp.]